MRHCALLLGLAALVAFATAPASGAIAVPNASFESPAVDSDPWYSDDVSNWEKVSDGRNVYVAYEGLSHGGAGNAYMTSADDGSQYLYTYSDREGFSPVDVRSEPVGSIEEGTLYELTIAVGKPSQNDDDRVANAEIRLLKGQDTDDDPFLDGPTVMASQGFTTPASDTWQDVVLSYTATSDDAGQELAVGVYWEYEGSNYQDNYIIFDDVSLVPEPATMALLGLGGLGALIRRR